MTFLRLFLLTTLAVLTATLAAAQSKRVALVIGNGAYTNAPAMPQATLEASAIAKTFRDLDFEVVEGTDLDYAEMRQIQRQFARQMRDAEIAVVYYSGHAFNLGDVNYVVPIDAMMDDPVDWEFQVFALEDVLRPMASSTGVNLVLLETSRANPLAAVLAGAMAGTDGPQPGAGLANVDFSTEGGGTAVAFTTASGPEGVASTGPMSALTSAILNHIATPNVSLQELLPRILGDVVAVAGDDLQPWINTSLTKRVVLNETAVAPAPAPAVVEAPAAAPLAQGALADDTNLAIQKTMFEHAMKSGDPADFEAYIQTFPEGMFVTMARNAIERAAEEQTAAAAPAAPATSAPQPTQPAAAVSDPAASAGAGLLPTFDIASNADRSARTTEVAVPGAVTAPPQPDLLAGPLLLTVTPALAQMPTSQQTEAELGLNRDVRREVQQRLNALGHNVGGADGSWGPKTRAGISAWQTSVGLIATGFFNMSQFELMRANSEAQLQTYLASRPAAAAPARKTTTRRTSTTRRKPKACYGKSVLGVRFKKKC